MEIFDYENPSLNCPIKYSNIINMLYASEASFGYGISITNLQGTNHFNAFALFETKTGNINDNIKPLGGTTRAVKTTKPTTVAQTTKPATAAPTTAASSPSVITADCLKMFRTTGLAQHNTLRAKHGAKVMTASSTIDESAQAYAQVLAAAGGNLVHSSSDYGENLWYNTDSRDMSLTKCMRKSN